jgi:hypothetical protein
LRKVGGALIAAFFGTAAHPGETDRGIAQQPGQFGDLPNVVASGGAQQISGCRFYAGVVVVAFIGWCVPEIHRPRQQVDRRDAVGQRMMHFADHREPTPGQALGEMKLPQRAATVQRRRGDLADDLVELSPPAGRRHLHPPQVVVQVDVAVLQPHRMVQAPRDINELVAQRVQQVQPAAQMTAESLVIEFAVEVRRVDDGHFQRVRVQVGRLAVEQHGVHAVESFHASPAFYGLR